MCMVLGFMLPGSFWDILLVIFHGTCNLFGISYLLLFGGIRKFGASCFPFPMVVAGFWDMAFLLFNDI